MLQDEYHERHLPHQIPANVPIFLTWNLKGAITREMAEQICQERQRLERMPARTAETSFARRTREDKLVFAFEDDLLGKASGGPMHLSDPNAAKIVVDSILFGVPQRYALYAFVVMGNHVHVVLTPVIPFEKITQGLKGYTAHKINQLQQATGRTFWQDESYDHWARDKEELLRIIAYVENNPVKAGLCQKPEDYLWSSARMRANWPVGQAFQPDVLGRSGFPA